MKVNGKVSSPDGPVADAQIILRVGDEQEHTVDSEDDGTFRFIDETDNIGKTLVCSVSKAGYQPWERPFEFVTDEVRPNVQLQPIKSAPWKPLLIIGSLILLAAWALLSLRSPSVTVTVPATSNPWLAGMSDRRESPVQVLDLKLKPGRRLTFTVTSTSPSESPTSADGLADMVQNGPEHGISGAKGPRGALVGVFLGVDAPAAGNKPHQQDFREPGERDKKVIEPAVEEVFFIGDGRTGAGDEQQVIIPNQASRLFLGTMDRGRSKDTKRSYQVVIKEKRR